MSNNNDEDNLIFIVLLLIGGGLIFVVWKFATAFGLDMTTAATVMWRMVVLCGVSSRMRAGRLHVPPTAP